MPFTFMYNMYNNTPTAHLSFAISPVSATYTYSKNKNKFNKKVNTTTRARRL
jgi:hypothetical protein